MKQAHSNTWESTVQLADELMLVTGTCSILTMCPCLKQLVSECKQHRCQQCQRQKIGHKMNLQAGSADMLHRMLACMTVGVVTEIQFMYCQLPVCVLSLFLLLNTHLHHKTRHRRTSCVQPEQQMSIRHCQHVHSAATKLFSFNSRQMYHLIARHQVVPVWSIAGVATYAHVSVSPQ